MERVLGFEADSDRVKFEAVEESVDAAEPEISVESTYEEGSEEETLSYFKKLAEGE